MKYLVVYLYQTKNGISGTGTSKTCTFAHNPPTADDIVEMENHIIAAEADFEKVAIVNWISLSDDKHEKKTSYKGMTPFKYFLKEIFHLYFSSDWNSESFVRAQKLEADFLAAKDAYPQEISYNQYVALHPLIQYLIEEMRNSL